jgi:hypothetical protein
VGGEGQRYYYVKVFGHLPAEPINVLLQIVNIQDNPMVVKVKTNLKAVGGAATSEEVMNSGNYLNVDDKQLAEWNGGDERDDNNSKYLKNI